jgi:hypothetical protein
MKFQFLYRAIVLLIIFATFLICSADDNQHVTAYALSSDAKVTPIEDDVTNIIREKLASKDLLLDDTVTWELIIAVREVDQNSIAIAVTILQSMPKEIVKAGSKSQIIYAFLEKDKSNKGQEQNQEIREYVTSEFLSNYKQAVESEIIITELEKIDEVCSNIVENFISKYL